MIFWGINGGQWDSTGYEEHMDYFRPEGDEMGANLNAYYPRPIIGSKQKPAGTKSLLAECSLHPLEKHTNRLHVA